MTGLVKSHPPIRWTGRSRMTNKKTDEGRMLCILFTLFAVPLFAILLQGNFQNSYHVPAHAFAKNEWAEEW